VLINVERRISEVEKQFGKTTPTTVDKTSVDKIYSGNIRGFAVDLLPLKQYEKTNTKIGDLLTGWHQRAQAIDDMIQGRVSGTPSQILTTQMNAVAWLKQAVADLKQ
jgi:hypothetical protein